MKPAIPLTGLLSALVLSACTVAPPSGPSVMALPPEGKSFAVFQQEDMQCRMYASQVTGGASPAAAASNAAVSSAVVGTALGAAAGAAIGSTGGQMGAGAAIGGATGLLAGSAIGASNAQYSAANLQGRYDMAYTQCMYAKGNTVQSAPGYVSGYPATYPGYAYPAYPYPYPYYSGPGVVIGGGWGWHPGWRRW